MCAGKVFQLNDDVNGSEYRHQTRQEVMLKVLLGAHVMDDLRPYICTHRVCPQDKTQYGSRIDFVDHELQKHEGASLYEEMTHTSRLNATSCSSC